VLSCLVLPCLVLSCVVLSCVVLSCRGVSCCVLPSTHPPLPQCQPWLLCETHRGCSFSSSYAAFRLSLYLGTVQKKIFVLRELHAIFPWRTEKLFVPSTRPANGLRSAQKRPGETSIESKSCSCANRPPQSGLHSVLIVLHRTWLRNIASIFARPNPHPHHNHNPKNPKS
jgi:hypothetical protein